MAVDTLNELRSEIADTIRRNSLLQTVTRYSAGTVESAIDRAIQKAEKRINRRLRVIELESSTTITLASSVASSTLPADFAGVRLIYRDSNPIVPITFQDPYTLFNTHPNTAQNSPENYTIHGIGANATNAKLITFRPVPSGSTSIVLWYYRTLEPLTDANPTNTILTNYPDLYLYGALIELMPYLRDDVRVQTWKGAFDEAIKDIEEDDSVTRWSGSPLVPVIGTTVV